MFAKKRRFEPAVIERLLKEPWRFDYFQAVRLLELWLGRHGKARPDPLTGVLRFRNSTSHRFPASQLEAIDLETQDDEGLRYVHVTPAFMGLLGCGGVLPAHYNERIAEHEARHKDEGPRAFLDTFSNRSLALFYEAWRKYRLPFKYQIDGKDRFLPLLLGLAGFGNTGLRERLSQGRCGEVLDESIGYFAAAIRHRPASSAQIARVLSEYFGQSVAAEQFVGQWYDVPFEQQTILGQATAVLGAGAMTGVRVWQRDLRLRLVVGPLDRASFDAFLPGGLAARALHAILTLFTGVTLEYEVELVLRAADVREVTLREGSNIGRLGWDAYLVEGEQERHRRDVRYELHAL
ncbi:type VI secretion system baseplate subunit TssG [Massilia norwichensis]|uniref:Type VI secretion system baseplate subunit TssG n=1 Tax=Massilia norwichensis TaxID=1442366 RepID=A0ABT2ABQ1_9BURK|nr:type VI secretion system baseplate subunit TssG [Massilia norwichensis]MCS0591639.1 type VI secretion system baseplate subunit TssG [Massilia norwichensis]